MGLSKRTIVLVLSTCMVLAAAQNGNGGGRQGTGAGEAGDDNGKGSDARGPGSPSSAGAGKVEDSGDGNVAVRSIPDLPALINCATLGILCEICRQPQDFVVLGTRCNITSIDLNGTNLSGPLASFARLADLPALKFLNLGNNTLTGPLPDRWFDKGQPAFPALEWLSLRNNSLTGSLPSDWVRAKNGAPAGFRELRELDLGFNLGLSGSLPSIWLGEKLKSLALDNCNFSGPLPDEWPEQFRPRLRDLVLNDNRLTGTLPATWAGLVRQLHRLSLQGNQLSGSLPDAWAWADEPSNSTSQVVLWPGNQELCGPVEAEHPDFLASMFTEDYTWGTGSRVPAQTKGSRRPGLGDVAGLHITNSLGSCAKPCSNASLGPGSQAANPYDLSWKRGVGLLALLHVNDPAALAAAWPGEEVELPCSTEAGAAYLGGDLAFNATAMTSRVDLTPGELEAAAGVVGVQPGQSVLSGARPFVVEANPVGPTGSAQAVEGLPFWLVDLGASVEVGVLLVTPDRPAAQLGARSALTIRVGDDSSNVEANSVCLDDVDLGTLPTNGNGGDDGDEQAALRLLLYQPLQALPGRCRGRYVIFSGERVGLTDVQVYPTAADAALNKDVLAEGQVLDTGILTDGNDTSCLAWSSTGVAPGDLRLNLTYAARVAAVTVVSSLPFPEVRVGLANNISDPMLTSSNVACKSTPLLVPAPGTGSQPLYATACSLLTLDEPAQYVVLAPQQAMQLCTVRVFLAEGPDQGQAGQAGSRPGSDDGSGSHVGLIAGATIGGLLGVAALASCVACGASYRAWRRTERRHAKLAKQLASQAGQADSNSKDGLVAAAALEAMSRAAHKSELQLISTFVQLKVRRAHDSVSSCVCCWGGSDEGGSDGDSPTNSRRRLLLPLYYLSGRRRQRQGSATLGTSTLESMDTNASSTAPIMRGRRQLPPDRSYSDGDDKKEDLEAGAGAPNALPLSMQAPPPPLTLQMAKLSSKDLGLVDYSDIEFGKYLGDGSFGSVYLARWKHVQVAVKVLQRIDPKMLHAEGRGLGSKVTRSGVIAEHTLRELAKEAGIMAALRHPCIVSYIGACLEPPCLVMEYCQRGSVYGVLSAASLDPAAASILTWPRLLRFAWDASKGMLYLHTLKPPIVHRDLKSANLLVDANWHVKISDFNLSRVMEPASVISTLSAANPRWMAPEVIHGEAPSLAADVFSFGVVLWELMTWDLPWRADMNPFQIANLVLAGKRLEMPPPDQLRAGPLVVYDDYVALVRSCWQDDPAARPTFEAIVKSLQVMTTKVVQASRSSARDNS